MKPAYPRTVRKAFSPQATAEQNPFVRLQQQSQTEQLQQSPLADLLIQYKKKKMKNGQTDFVFIGQMKNVF